MDALEVTLTLVSAPDDTELKSPGFQKELRNFREALVTSGIETSSAIQLLEAWAPEPAPTIYLGDFTIKFVAAVGPIIGAAIGAFVQARFGRKVRLKIGEIEAEAQTPEQVERLVEMAQAIQERTRAKVISES